MCVRVWGERKKSIAIDGRCVLTPTIFIRQWVYRCVKCASANPLHMIALSRTNVNYVLAKDDFIASNAANPSNKDC